jgi:hypothetical protein
MTYHTSLPDGGRIPHVEIDDRLPTAKEKQALLGSDLNTHYFGDPNTDGSWRLYFDGTNLLVQVRDSGAWVTEGWFSHT